MQRGLVGNRQRRHGGFLFPPSLLGLLLSPGLGGMWSSGQAAKGVSTQQEQPWGRTGFLLCCWQYKVLLPSRCPAELSEASPSRRSLAKSLVCLIREVPGQERDLLSCSASGVWVGLQHAVLHTWPWWVFLLQCNTALDFTWCGTSGHARRPPVVTPWPPGTQISVQAKEHVTCLA